MDVNVVNHLRGILPSTGPMADQFLPYVLPVFHQIELLIENVQANNVSLDERLFTIERIIGLNSYGTFFTRLNNVLDNLIGQVSTHTNPDEVDVSIGGIVIDSTTEALDHLETTLGISNDNAISSTARLYNIQSHIGYNLISWKFRIPLTSGSPLCFWRPSLKSTYFHPHETILYKVISRPFCLQNETST